MAIYLIIHRMSEIFGLLKFQPTKQPALQKWFLLSSYVLGEPSRKILDTKQTILEEDISLFFARILRIFQIFQHPMKIAAENIFPISCLISIPKTFQRVCCRSRLSFLLQSTVWSWAWTAFLQMLYLLHKMTMFSDLETKVM